MNSAFRKDRVAHWLFGILLISLFMLVITFLRYQLRETTGITKLLILFNLTGENNFAAWWSGILLLLACIHAFDGYVLYREHQPRVARGWASLSIILLILSADEIGSIHERAGQILQLGSWRSLLPFAVILMSMLGYALISLWSAKELRTRTGLIAFAFFLFATVALQEYLSNNREWMHTMPALRNVVEEGTELLAMFILLKVCMSNSTGLWRPTGPVASPAFDLVSLLRVPILVVGLFSVPVLAYATVLLPDQSRGHPADWLTAVIFLFAAVAAVQPLFKPGAGTGTSRWVLALVCCIASSVSIAVAPKHIIHAGFIEMNVRMLAISGLSFLFSSVWFFFVGRAGRIYVLAGIAAGVLFLGFSIVEVSLFFLYALPALPALLIYYLSSAENLHLYAFVESRAESSAVQPPTVKIQQGF